MWGRGPTSLIFMWIQYILLKFFSRVYAFRTMQREQALFTTVYLAQCLASNRYSKYTWWNLYLVTQSCLTLCNPMNCSLPGSSVHGDSPGKNTGVGCHALFQGIFPTQGLNPGLPHCRGMLYWLSHKGSQRILEWVAYPFSSSSSWPRNQTGVSCITHKFFISWATWQALADGRSPFYYPQ